MTMIVSTEVRDHLAQFLDHFASLTPEDRYCRFFNTLGPSAIREWLLNTTETPYSHYFFVDENQNGEFTGVAQLAVYTKSNTADLAISVRPDCRGQGLAKRLVTEAIDEARRMKISKVFFECRPYNRECKALYNSLGFTIKFDVEQLLIVGHLDLGE